MRRNGSSVEGIAVTSTSGTLVITREDGEPLRPAVMYDDGRAAPHAATLRNGSWNASYSLAKALWVREVEPGIWECARRLLHPADWLTGRLCGSYDTCDYSNALKLGYEARAWRVERFRQDRRNSRSDATPSSRPGAGVGELSPDASKPTGLPEGTPVYAGATDGIASLIASAPETRAIAIPPWARHWCGRL